MGIFSFENFETAYPNIFRGSTIDWSQITFLDPWAIAETVLFAAQHHNDPGANFLLPENDNILSYLSRIHLYEFLDEAGYKEAATFLKSRSVGERENHNLHEIVHCKTQDAFDGRLGRFVEIFKNFGMDEYQARLMTAIVGELGNNAFDHNWGNWSSDLTGCIILAQRYERPIPRIQVIIADFGSGFLASLQSAYPEIQDDISAIKKGLAGFTGRIGERRGNGLRTVQNWTVDKFRGTLSLHSGEGLAGVNASGVQTRGVPDVRGTIAQLMIEDNERV